ncbi:MFS transporter [Rhodococcus opacus]|uniref:MFS transporter n=1 Tax=Rhodococcus opacus TaxID=37919 RepID=A0A2S8J6Z8_RHOOP|nr:aromatic acid/H+ symport family MFS transporter [Rhodococcus opacus]PQP22816.1 MFS transporter [Rhodococcus opacus]
MPTSTENTIDRAPRIVLVLAFLVLMLEGYDIIMYGTVVPSLLTYSSWSVTPEDAGHIGSLAVLGMLFGALGAAVLNDRLGRRRVLIGSVLLFSIAMLAAAAAGSPGQLGAFRFLVGVGAGSLLPTAVAMVIEYSPASRRGLNTAIAFTGVGLGGILASLLGTWIAPNYGFRLMFAIGALPALIIVPMLWLRLPESLTYLSMRGRHDEARRTAERLGVSLPVITPRTTARGAGLETVRALVTSRHLISTLLFSAAVFFCLLVLFGANAWLPSLMIKAGYGVSSSLAFLLVLNIGATAGTLLASPIADRIGFKPVIVAAFLGAAGSLSLLAAKPSTLVVVALVAIAGLGTNGTQILINAYVGSYYPADLRAAALGIVLGVGRIGGILGPTYGAMVIADLSPSWQFHAFAIPAAIGAAFITWMPRRVDIPPRLRHAAVDPSATR